MVISASWNLAEPMISALNLYELISRPAIAVHLVGEHFPAVKYSVGMLDGRLHLSQNFVLYRMNYRLVYAGKSHIKVPIQKLCQTLPYTGIEECNGSV